MDVKEKLIVLGSYDKTVKVVEIENHTKIAELKVVYEYFRRMWAESLS